MDYETAMKKAVEEADAAKEAASKKKRVSSSPSRIPSLFDLRDMVVAWFSSLWKQKQGRIIQNILSQDKKKRRLYHRGKYPKDY